MTDLSLLKDLCALEGISGCEDKVRERILQEITPYVTDVRVDPLGSIIAFKKGKARAKTDLMLSAHMDEVGLIVTHITEEGFLKFTTVGGIDKRILVGKRVSVNGVPGVIGAKPTHMLKGDQRGAAVPLDELTIDIGAASKEEAEAVVAPGDPVCFASEFFVQDGAIFGKALDDRAGCAILIELIRQELPYDMTFVFCVQEEIGLRGAKAAAYSVAPEAAIVVETTTAADLPDITGEQRVCTVGGGPVVSFMDRATIYDRKFYELAFALAKEQEIPCQTKHMVAGGNDAGAIHQSRGGVRTISVSLPCRYLHGPTGRIAQSDYRHAQELILSLANSIAGSSEP